jgi:hypothetical protein
MTKLEKRAFYLINRMGCLIWPAHSHLRAQAKDWEVDYLQTETRKKKKNKKKKRKAR